MQRKRTMKTIIHACLPLVFLLCSVLPGHSAELTERDWMITLVDACGWSYGLPDVPQDPDYINILSGNRAFRFDAEDIYDIDRDNVSVMTYQNFGTFSGRGWLHGTREATKVHLSFTLPIGGEYEIQAQLLEPGHLFSINNSVKKVDATGRFSLITVGTFQLQAGVQKIVVTLPPGGGIDYLTLKAANLPTIAPKDGWQPDKSLTWEMMQATLMQLLNVAELFPLNLSPLVFEAEDLAQSDVLVVDIPHLGRPSGGKWLRAGALPATVRFPVKLAESGFYDLSVRAMGNPIDISLAGHQDLKVEAKDYLDDYIYKALFFFAGDSNITLSLPPGGGVDQLTLAQRQIDPTLASKLLNLQQTDKPQPRDLDTYTSLLAAFGVKR